MLEEEAKTKRCGGPDGTGTVVNPVTGKIPQTDYSRPRWCIASDCMMWKWSYEDTADGEGMHPYKLSKTKGYCGLAK